MKERTAGVSENQQEIIQDFLSRFESQFPFVATQHPSHHLEKSSASSPLKNRNVMMNTNVQNMRSKHDFNKPDVMVSNAHEKSSGDQKQKGASSQKEITCNPSAGVMKRRKVVMMSSSGNDINNGDVTSAKNSNQNNQKSKTNGSMKNAPKTSHANQKVIIKKHHSDEKLISPDALQTSKWRNNVHSSNVHQKENQVDDDTDTRDLNQMITKTITSTKNISSSRSHSSKLTPLGSHDDNRKKYSSTGAGDDFCMTTPENASLKRILMHQDQQLQLISNQIEKLLRIHSHHNSVENTHDHQLMDGDDDDDESSSEFIKRRRRKKMIQTSSTSGNNNNRKPEMCSVQTMTSITLDRQSSPSTPKRSSDSHKKTPSPPIMMLSKKPDDRRHKSAPSDHNNYLSTINESSSTFDTTSQLVLNSTKDTTTPSIKSFKGHEIELSRGVVYTDDDDATKTRGKENDSFYDQIISNIDHILKSSPSDDSSLESSDAPNLDYTRSSCSPGTPKISRGVQKVLTKRSSSTAAVKRMVISDDDQNIRSISSETIYIKKLASKYLMSPKKGNKSVPHDVSRTKKTSSSSSSKKDVMVYGISSDVSSIATKNYLTKYGLIVNAEHEKDHIQQNNTRTSKSKKHLKLQEEETDDNGIHGHQRTSRLKNTSHNRLIEHHSHQQSVSTGTMKILDMEKLKRQPKFL